MKNHTKKHNRYMNKKLKFNKKFISLSSNVKDFDVLSFERMDNKIIYILKAYTTDCRKSCSISLSKGLFSKNKKIRIEKPFIVISEDLYNSVIDLHYKFIIGHELGHMKIKDKDIRPNQFKRNLYEELMCDLYSIKHNNINLQDFYKLKNDLIKIDFYKREMKIRFKILEKLMIKYQDGSAYDKVIDSYISYIKTFNTNRATLISSNNRNKKDIIELNKNRLHKIPVDRISRQIKIKKIIKRNKEL